jgi:hypothetical protein
MQITVKECLTGAYSLYNDTQQHNQRRIKMDYLVYGLEQGESRDYMESLLASNCRNLNDVDKVKLVASAAGFHSFRVATFNWEKPNFTNTLNKGL